MKTRNTDKYSLPVHQTRFLQRHGVPYSLIQAGTETSEAHTPRGRAVALEDNSGAVAALLPEDHILDIQALNELMRRYLTPISKQRYREVFPDCPADTPPIPAIAYGVESVIDVSLFAGLGIVFPAAGENIGLSIATRDFQYLMRNAHLGRFSLPATEISAQQQRRSPDPSRYRSSLKQLFPERAARAADSCEELPPLPATPRRLLEVMSDHGAGVRDLTAVIEQDSAIAARILKYANSPLYGMRGKIGDLSGAISRVMGFDTAIAIAFNMCLNNTLTLPDIAGMGPESHQRNAVYCAALTQGLAQHIGTRFNVSRGKAYMSGLLRDVGLLFLGHSFPDQYRLLSYSLALNPGIPLTKLEQLLPITGHPKLAGRLLSAWGLPAELVTAAQHQHDPDYEGEYAVYPRLVGLASALLESHGFMPYNIGMSGAIPELARTLELKPDSLEQVLETVMQSRDALEEMTRLAA